MQCKISVIVPVYNVENYLNKCLQSLVNQTMKDIEIILVDDGSTDNSGKICDKYKELYDNIKVIHKKNEGLGMARNSGLEEASGEYVAFVDSDDYVSGQMFEILYDNAIKYNADISYGGNIRFLEEEDVNVCNNINDTGNYKSKLKLWSGKKEIYRHLMSRIGLPPSSKADNFYGANVWGGIFRRFIIEKHKIEFVSERELIAEDIIFDIDYIQHCEKIVYFDDVLYYYRYNPDSLTAVYRADRYEKNIILYNEMYARLLKVYRYEECFNAMSRYLITVSRIAVIQEINLISKNGFIKACRNVKEICANDELQKVLNKYEYKKLPVKYRLICGLQKHKQSLLIVLLITLFYGLKRKNNYGYT